MMLTLLLIVATQRVSGNVPEKIRAGTETVEAEFQYVETNWIGRSAEMRWKMLNPPESNQTLPKGTRARLERVQVRLVDCIDVQGAKKYFDDAIAKVGKDGDLKGIGEGAVFNRMGGEDSLTVVALRVGQYFVDVTAPSGPIARRFARATADSLAK